MKKVELKLDYEDFKRLKSGKKTVITMLYDEKIKDLNKNSKIVAVNDYNKSKLRLKVKRIVREKNVSDLILRFTNKELGFSKNDNNVLEKIESGLNIEKNNVCDMVGIKVKRKKKIFRRVILLFLLLVVLIFSSFLIKNTINSFISKKIVREIKEIENDKSSYVIVEINPKMVLEIKNNKVIDTGCINQDCVDVFKTINIINKDIKDAVNELYEIAKNNNIDVSNGVIISSTNEDIKNKFNGLNYIKYSQINNSEENSYTSQVFDNNNIKNNKSLDEYNDKLLSIYKKDSDYGKYYTCKTEDELECYLTNEFIDKFSYLLSGGKSEEEMLKKIILNTLENDPVLQRIFDKFNVQYKTETYFGITGITEIKINDLFYELRTSIHTPYNSVGAGVEIRDVENGIVVLEIQNLNLCNSSYKDEDLKELKTSVE